MHSFVWIFRYRIQSKAKAKSHPLSEIKKWHSRSRATEKHTAPIVATQFLTVTENAKVESAFLPKKQNHILYDCRAYGIVWRNGLYHASVEKTIKIMTHYPLKKYEGNRQCKHALVNRRKKLGFPS